MHGKNVEKNSFGRLYRSNGTKTILDVALTKNICILVKGNNDNSLWMKFLERYIS